MLTATCKQHFCKVCRDVGNHRFADLPRNAFLKISKAIFVNGIKCFTLQGVSTYQQHFADNNHYFLRILLHLSTGPALADAGPNAGPTHGAPLSNDFMASSCLVTIIFSTFYSKSCIKLEMVLLRWANG